MKLILVFVEKRDCRRWIVGIGGVVVSLILTLVVGSVVGLIVGLIVETHGRASLRLKRFRRSGRFRRLERFPPANHFFQPFFSKQQLRANGWA